MLSFSTCSKVVKVAALAIMLVSVKHACAAADIPVFSNASDAMRKSYARDNFPKSWPRVGAESATVLVYHLPKSTNLDDVTNFYSTTLATANWVPGPVSVFDSERYSIFTLAKEQLTVHVKQGADWVAVDAIDLAYPVVRDAPVPIGTNMGEAVLTRPVNSVQPGSILHIVCPAGQVQVRSHQGPGVQLSVKVHAGVDYPGLAANGLKDLQLVVQNEAAGLTLGVDTGAAGRETSTHLAYEFTVLAPEGVDIQVDVQKPVDTLFQVPDGKVVIKGAFHDVDVNTTGPVDVWDATGKVLVTTLDDPVMLRNLSGDVTVHTTGYWIKAYGLTLSGCVDLETVDGQIEAHVKSVEAGSLKCKTTNSNVLIWLPRESSVGVDASAENVRASFDWASVPDGKDSKSYKAVLNGGKFPVELDTTGGGTVYIQNK